MSGMVPEKLVRDVDSCIAQATTARLGNAAALLKIARLELLISRHEITDGELQSVLDIAKRELPRRPRSRNAGKKAKRKAKARRKTH